VRLNEVSIKALPFPEKGQKTYFDDSLPGFCVRVSTRSKSFVVVYGKERRFKTLGRHPELSLAEARKEAKRFFAYLPSKPSSKHTYDEAVEQFLKYTKDHNRPETIRQYKTYLTAFKCSKKLDDITRSELKAHLDSYKDRKSAYVHSLASLRVFFNWCLRQEIIDKYPLAGERLIPVPSRDRVLSPEEIKEVWAYDYPHFSTIIKLCLLTGQRRSEVAQISPDWIQDDVLTFPDTITKNKRKHSIPVSSWTMELLEEVPFGQNGKPWNGWSNGKKRIDKHLEIPHWTIHDLRRTFATIHAEIGTPIHITEKLLNHASGSISGVASVYNRYSYLDEMREAQENYQDYLQDIV